MSFDPDGGKKMGDKVMRKSLIAGTCLAVVLLLAVTLVVAGCGGSSTTTTASTTTSTAPSTTTTVAPMTTTTGAGGAPTTAANGGAPTQITVSLSGAESVPPVTTSASGSLVITIQASATGFDISYELDVTNIVDVTAAHIHLGAKGANGPVIVPLFTGPQKSGSFTGVLAKGTLSAADLTGPMAGKTFTDLATAVLSGQTYVNVHTVKNPNGEIRGQVIIQAAAGTPTT